MPNGREFSSCGLRSPGASSVQRSNHSGTSRAEQGSDNSPPLGHSGDPTDRSTRANRADGAHRAD